ncbi:MAG: hypothetical protein A2Y33_12590 [Spirochaetes bacterium GWF1_51_8]|nr:MAG: hypothetical protein A2Y33_12590 [Spirochaetes bacterium GWF1_51_8]
MKNALCFTVLLAVLSCGQADKSAAAANEYGRLLGQAGKSASDAILLFEQAKNNADILSILTSAKDKFSSLEKALIHIVAAYHMSDQDIAVLLNSTSDARNDALEKLEAFDQAQSANTLKFIDITSPAMEGEYIPLLQDADELNASMQLLKNAIMFR